MKRAHAVLATFATIALGGLLSAALFGFSSARTHAATTEAKVASAVSAKAPRDKDSEVLSPSMKLALQRLSGSSGADRAVEAAEALARRQTTKDDAWIRLGHAWVRKARESGDPGFYLNADACASIVLERDAENALALGLRGLVLLNGHKFQEALELAKKVVGKHPEDPMAWGTMSDALLELGQYEEATRAAQSMIDLKPNLPSYSRASHLAWLHGDRERAKSTVRLALDAGRDTTRDPEPRAWVLVQAAMIFWHEGDYEGAEAGFDKALEAASDFAPANVGKGRVAMTRGDARRAAELFQRAFTASPLVETAWLLGDAREASGDAKGAAEAFAYVEREGRRSDPRTLSLYWAAKNKEVGEALRLAEEEYAVRKDVVTEDAVAWALYRNGRTAEAKERITRARRLRTPDARLLYHEGAIRAASGETEKGRTMVAEALKMNGAFCSTEAPEAKALLMKLGSR
jgi:tetratricopeptide (TPR) repeat protein